MQLETFPYTPDSEWSCKVLPALDSDQTLVIIFGAPSFIDAPEPIHEITRAYPNAHIVGCSTSGEVLGTTISDESLAVGVIRFERTTVATAIAAVQMTDKSYAAGETLACQLHRPSLRGVFILSDGQRVNGSELVRGINSVLPSSTIVTGGLAGDGARFKNTWVLKDGTPHRGFISAVGFYGDRVEITHGSKGGWDRFGPEKVVTRSKGSVLYEIDGEPALELYKEYLGDRAAGLPATALLFPLSLRANPSTEVRVVRTVLGVDEQAQSMTFAGDIPQGYLAQFMWAGLDRLINGARESALMARARRMSTAPILSIAISCVGRRLVLGDRTEEELEATLNTLPKGTQQIGFYSHGEISPYQTGYCDLHNQTMTLTVIGEK